MSFSLYDEFSEFHIFKGFKSLIFELWSSDIFLIEKGTNGFFYSPNTLIYNPITKTLLDYDLFKEDFFKSLTLISKEKLEPNKIYTTLWKQVGTEIFVIPVIIEGSLEGFVVSAGFMPHNRRRLNDILDYLKKGKSWQEKEIAKLKKPGQKDLAYLKKLLCILVAESSSLYKQKREQRNLIEKFRKRSSKSQNLIGKSVAMQFLYRTLDKVQNLDTPLLIQGEIGTGKKLVAKIIHEHSSRKESFFQIVDCSSINELSLKSELFGKEGSEEKQGLFKQASSGTLVLDKIEATSLNFQAKLLEFLNKGIFFPVKSTRTPKKSNVRILALSAVNLVERVKEGSFKENLYNKLNTINLHVPALRDRLEDIPYLVRYFFTNKFPEKNKKFSSKAMKHFLNYQWPGNVKELQTEIEKMIVLSEDVETLLTEDHLSSKFYKSRFQIPQDTTSLKQALNHFEKNLILSYLEKENWNKSAVAKKLNLSRTSLIYKTKIYGLVKRKEA